MLLDADLKKAIEQCTNMSIFYNTIQLIVLCNKIQEY